MTAAMTAAPMASTALATLSNNFVYSAMAVYAFAFLAYAAHVAALMRLPATEPARSMQYAGGAQGDTAPPEQPVLQQGRHERWGRIGTSLTVLAFLLHLAGLLSRTLAVGRAPWGNMYEFSVAGGLAVTGFYLYSVRKWQARYLGVLVVPAVLLSLGLAVTVLYAEAGELVPALRGYWLVIHVSAMVVSLGIFSVGAAFSVLHLLAGAASLRARLSWLPSAERLDALAYRVHAFAFPIYTFGVLAGAIWAEDAWGRYWNWDPKETWSFITWIVYAAYLHARATAGWKGRRAAGIALLAYACFLFNYFAINLVVTGLHSYAR